MKVKAWEEIIKLPTYEIGKPEKNPMFLEKRVYQGSSGVVYPHPVVEKILDDKVDREWTALFLENEYLKIMILPELGGRIQMAFDKTKNRHFVYYNQVIKPALVGLIGPWISGGIEFNWPQHHRPSTFDKNNPDFSAQYIFGISKTDIFYPPLMPCMKPVHKIIDPVFGYFFPVIFLKIFRQLQLTARMCNPGYTQVPE